MKIELPLETWTELFGFVPRSQLMQLVPHIGEASTRYLEWGKCQQTIGDRQFVSFIQFYLHKCGEVTFGRLHIKASRIVIVNGNENNWMPLADVPIPENVKDFKSLLICNFDEPVADFLQQFQRNSLLDNVDLFFNDCLLNFLPRIMTNIVPVFTSINSIEICWGKLAVLDKLQSEYSQLAIPMLKSVRVLISDYNHRDAWFCDWLNTPREDGKPRVLILHGWYLRVGRPFSHFIEHIKKDFLEANQAVSFFVKRKWLCSDVSVQSQTLENSQTQEKLVIKGANGFYDPVMILRYPMGINEEEWIEEMSQQPEVYYYYDRIIEFGS